jgi:hypothetical protein
MKISNIFSGWTLALVVACGSFPAPAQTLVPKQIELGDFGACLFKQAPRESTELLRSELASPKERTLAKRLAEDHVSCIHGRGISGYSGAIRGAVAQAALLRDRTLLDALARRATAPAIRPPRARGRQFLIAYAQCLIAADPQHTVAFLETPYSSDAERSGFLAYGNALTSCMPFGEQFHVDIPDLRNQVAAIAWQTASSLGGEPHHA